VLDSAPCSRPKKSLAEGQGFFAFWDDERGHGRAKLAALLVPSADSPWPALRFRFISSENAQRGPRQQSTARRDRSPQADPALSELRVPPHSIEAEQSVLGGLLLDNAAFDKIADVITEGDFYRDEHKRIYRQICKLLGTWQAGRRGDGRRKPRPGRRGRATGGLAYLGELAANTPSAANIRRYAEIVRERAILRQLVTAGDEIAGSALNPLGRDPKTLLDEAEAKVFAIAEGGFRHQSGFVHINPLLTQVVERIQELHDRDNPSDITGVPTGYHDLDSQDFGPAGR
jgi:replicative DNA helicase